MSPQLYDIYYLEGLQPGISATQAAQRLIELTQLSEQQAQLLIASTQRVVKSGLTKDHAVKYLNALQKVGMKVEIRHPQQPPQPASQPDESAPPLDEDIVAAVKRKQASESSLDFDRTRK